MADASYRALLIGNSTFPNDSHNLQPLEGPVNDVAQLHAALTHPEVGLFEHDAVRMLPERTRGEVELALEQFFATSARDNRLLLYYSGHGVKNNYGELFLCTRDTRMDRLLSTAVSSGVINRMIDDSPAQTTVIVLDCCHSGAFKSGNLPASLSGFGRFLLTSCRSRELANDATIANRTSAFTSHLVEGILKGAADRDGDGYVDLDELYDYVYERLSFEGRQIPQRQFSGGGDMAIARRRTPLSHTSVRRQRTPTNRTRKVQRFSVSETTINLDGVHFDEVIPLETVYVSGVDWAVQTDADWVKLKQYEDRFTIGLHPRAPINRANVVVRNRASAEARTVRVTVCLVDAPSQPLVLTPNEPTPAQEQEEDQIAETIAISTIEPTVQSAGSTSDTDQPSTPSPPQEHEHRPPLTIFGTLPARQAEPAAPAPASLISLEQRLLAALTALNPSASSAIYIHPNIPEQKLLNARQKAQVPEEENVLALVDSTFFGSAADCLVFGTKGVFYHYSADTRALPYSEFSTRKFSRVGIGRVGVGLGEADLVVGIPKRVVAMLKAVQAELP